MPEGNGACCKLDQILSALALILQAIDALRLNSGPATSELITLYWLLNRL